MLSPEVWNFKAPDSQITSTVGDLSKENKLPDKVNSFYFTHLISVITPEGTFPRELLNDCDYYKVSNLSIEELVNDNFLNNFVKTGQLTALSIYTKIDVDDCICITPTGKLILSLTKESYQSLGLQGQVSHYTKNTKNSTCRYIVTVDLRANQLARNKKNADVPKCLKKLGLFTMIIIWEPPTNTVCPSSVAKYFNDLGYEVNLCRNAIVPEILSNVEVPIVRYEDEEDVLDVIEWLGVVSLNCPANFSGTHLSSYATPSPFVNVPNVRSHQLRGFFTPTTVLKLINNLRVAMRTQWFSIYVQGFSDSPVNWKYNEHHYFTNGDNGYIFLFNRYKYMFATNQTSNKRYK